MTNKKDELLPALRNIFRLTDKGKRRFHQKSFQVAEQADQDNFEYCQAVSQVLFGPKGLVETLGPTWEMVHDPRFEALENSFVIEKKALLGGDATEGLQRQLEDGTFTGSMAGLQQYAEILGEGRHLIGTIRSFAIIEILEDQFPDRKLRLSAADPHAAFKMVYFAYPEQIHQLLKEAILAPLSEEARGLVEGELADKDMVALWAYAVSHDVAQDFFVTNGILSITERAMIRALVAEKVMYRPHEVKNWTDDRIWALIRLEYTNYFSRRGAPNNEAKTLFKLIKTDLLGLVADFCEVANVDEKVLLDDVNTLYDPAVHNNEYDEAAWVSMEVENLERALTYRNELRINAANTIQRIGLTPHLVDMTDEELDKLVKILYSSKRWPIDPQTITAITQFLASIKLTFKSVEQRQFEQLAAASIASQDHVDKLRTGEIQQITRHTDGIAETTDTGNMAAILGSPMHSHLFLRLTDIERRIIALEIEFLRNSTPRPDSDLEIMLMQVMSGTESVVEEDRNLYPDFKKFFDYLQTVVRSALVPGELVLPPFVAEAQVPLLNSIVTLTKARAILLPAFEGDAISKITDQEIADMLVEVETLDPTPVAKPIPQYEGEYNEAHRLPDPEPPVQ